MSIHVLITAGGTTESVDAVRTITGVQIGGVESASLLELIHTEVSNISKGRFPLEIARALQRMSSEQEPVEVVLVAKHELVAELRRHHEVDGLRLVPFRSFSDLRAAIEREILTRSPDLFIMAAAVSDYSPVPYDGKISSSLDELVIRMTRNPKLLDSLRDQLGEQAVLVGFKLLAGVSPELLIQTAQAQARKSRLDFSVGNDARRIDWESGHHPIVLVDAHGCRWELDSGRREAADCLAWEFLTAVAAKRMVG